jgi:Tfp pilus assembly protein PilO
VLSTPSICDFGGTSPPVAVLANLGFFLLKKLNEQEKKEINLKREYYEKFIDAGALSRYQDLKAGKPKSTLDEFEKIVPIVISRD